MSKKDLTLNNLHWLICHKIKTNKTKPNYLTHGWGDKEVHTFSKGINSNVKVILQLDVL